MNKPLASLPLEAKVPTTFEDRQRLITAARLFVDGETREDGEPPIREITIPSLVTESGERALPQRIQVDLTQDPEARITYTTLSGPEGPEKTHRDVQVSPGQALSLGIVALEQPLAVIIASDLETHR